MISMALIDVVQCILHVPSGWMRHPEPCLSSGIVMLHAF